MKTKTSSTTNLTNRSSRHRATVAPVLITVVLACAVLSPTAPAVVPAPDGGYPNFNTAEGEDALFSLDTSQGAYNTAMGFEALFSDTTGDANTATGAFALLSNTTGSENTASGRDALAFNTTGSTNTAVGGEVLINNTIGNSNTAIGFSALLNNTTGSNNIALGSEAGINLTTGSNNIDIGNRGVAGEANTIRIGRQGRQTAAFIAGISGAPVPTGVAVIVDGSGHLGTTTSSARFKEAIKPMDKASEAIHALRPVTFRYKHDLDPEDIPQFGLVAEEVEKVNPDLVARDAAGKAYTVRYEAVNAMLLNEFLKEHRKVESLEKAMAEQQKENAAMRAMLKEQAAQIQNVSAKLATGRVGVTAATGLEVRKSSSQIVLSNQ